MYIKSITLQGFKSYAKRVEITGFDPEFNAITGFNGTGKSNILDSICFVLGITNLSNVRAKSLQELIYNNGQAGVTKASVSITFDNRDKSQCPVGYESKDEITVTRQVMVGGKTKYLINGVTAQNKRVTDLFCSVHLNVNKPHFLIMQGRITKVLNMKPPEILSMVEEAAGTSFYETKKTAALKMIEKKDASLRELTSILDEVITPTLQKLQTQRTQFQEHERIVQELTKLTRLNVVKKYIRAEDYCKEASTKIPDVKKDIDAKRCNILNNQKEIQQLDSKMAELDKKLEEESGTILKELNSLLANCEKTESIEAAAYKAAMDNLSVREKQAQMLENVLKEDQAALRSKTEQLNEFASTFEGLKSASEESNKALEKAQQKYLAVSVGMEDATDSVQDQLMAVNSESSEASTRIAQSNMEIRHNRERLQELEAEFGNTCCSEQYYRDQASIATKRAVVEQLQDELSRMRFDEEAERSLKGDCRSKQVAVRAQQDVVDRFAIRLPRCQFSYTMPEPLFDRSRVAGLICKLIKPIDPIYCAAIGVAAGARLYNVIVDTEVTSKLLLEKSDLQQRTTFIPLNKIRGQVLDRSVVDMAQDIGGGPDNVKLALDLITYSPEHRPAMAWIFGKTLVCRDLDVARRVTFHPEVMARCVTFDGDVCDPAGILSGGASLQGSSILQQVQEQQQAESKLRQLIDELHTLTAQLDRMQQAGTAYWELKDKYDLACFELETVSARVARTAPAQLHEQILTLRESLAKCNENIEQDKVIVANAELRLAELREKVGDLTGHREREFAKAEEALREAKKAAEEHGTKWQLREQEYKTLTLEVSELRAAVGGSGENLSRCLEDVNAAKQDADAAASKYDEAKKIALDAKESIIVKKAEISSGNTNVADLFQRKERLDSEISDLQLGIKGLELTIKDLKEEAKKGADRMKLLEEGNSWIASEKHLFREEGGPYDLTAQDVSDERENALRERRDDLKRGLNARAQVLLASMEDKYNEILRKKEIIEQDRDKILNGVTDLDEKKKALLLKACDQVNKDFGSIFSTLLPGTIAKLVPQPGKQVSDGLQVQVGFGDTWKESLSELSGGQRSLVALSLVLSMLLFKPAPLYILDEVDAALDLSHTQNIGQMLKEHFKASQFVVVSLKEGMFNNANVLFRTQFVDGMSTVQRFANESR